jgi:hypothetical protein
MQNAQFGKRSKTYVKRTTPERLDAVTMTMEVPTKPSNPMDKHLLPCPPLALHPMQVAMLLIRMRPMVVMRITLQCGMLFNSNKADNLALLVINVLQEHKRLTLLYRCDMTFAPSPAVNCEDIHRSGIISTAHTCILRLTTRFNFDTLD